MGVSDALIGKHATMVRRNQVTYVDLCTCTSGKEEEDAKVDKRSVKPCDVSTVHGAWGALQRRSFAMQSAGICSHEVWYQEYGKWLWNQQTGENEERFSFLGAALEPIDRSLWRKVSDLTKGTDGGLVQDDGNGRPVGLQLTPVFTSLEVKRWCAVEVGLPEQRATARTTHINCLRQ